METFLKWCLYSTAEPSSFDVLTGERALNIWNCKPKSMIDNQVTHNFHRKLSLHSTATEAFYLFFFEIIKVMATLPIASTFFLNQPGVNCATHPLIAHKMTLLRNRDTAPHEFRRILREITFYLGYEASRSLNMEKISVQTPMDCAADGYKVKDTVSLIPILRAGLGMTDGMLDLIPKASIHHIGMYRSKDSLVGHLFILKKKYQ